MSPDFQLTMYEDKTLPVGKQLFSLEALVGHTIKAAFDFPDGTLDADYVLVTETDCFIAMQSQMDGYCREDGTSITVLGHSRQPEQRTLSDYVCAEYLLSAGVITRPVFDRLLEIRKESQDKKQAEKAKELRAQLAKLEGGAA